MMSTGKKENSIIVTKEYIQNNDHENLAIHIITMPIDTEDYGVVRKLFKLFMTYCREYDAEECAQVIYNYWDATFGIETDDIPLFVQLFLENFNKETLIYMKNTVCYSFTYDEMMDVVTDETNGPESTKACQLIDDIFGIQSINIYRKRYIETNENISNPNYFVIEFLEYILKREEEYAEYPWWVFPQTNPPYEDSLEYPEEQDFDVDVSNINDVLSLLLEGSVKQDIEYEEEKEALRIEVLKLSLDKLKELVKSVLLHYNRVKYLEDNHIFNIWGPANPFESMYSYENKFGGSRLFLSDVKEKGGAPYDIMIKYTTSSPEGGEAKNTYNANTWYTGTCDKCMKKIRRKWHALRRPFPEGGWIGCYCSPECIRDMILQNETDNVLELTMLSGIVKDLKRIGIQDRIPKDWKKENEQEKILINKVEGEPDVIIEYSNESEEEYFFDITKIGPGKINKIDDYDYLADVIEEKEKFLIVVFFNNDESYVKNYIDDIFMYVEYAPEIIFINYNLSVNKDIDSDSGEITFYNKEEVLKSEIVSNFNDFKTIILGTLREFLIDK